MKKKILSAVLALCLAFGSAAALPQSAVVESTSITASAEGETKKSGNYEYTILKDGTAEITRYNGTESKVTIPSKLGGNVVTSIGSYAFNSCSSLTSVTIQNGIKSIGVSAFYHCFNLTSVIIPSSVTGIGYAAFSNCSSLTSVSIPSGVTSIDGEAFAYCRSLTSVTIPSSVKSIGIFAFSGTKWLESIQKNNPLVIINGILIDGTKCIGNVVIPDDVTCIVGAAFNKCLSITSVSIPNGVKYIGESAFKDCYNLLSVTIPSSVKSIGDSAFENCRSLKSVTIPSSVASIGKKAIGYFWDYSYDCLTINKNFTIIGFKGTAAEKYAEKNGIKFKQLPWYYLESSENEVTVAKDSLKDLTLIYHRSKDDSETFSNFVGVDVDGSTVDVENYTAESGGLKLTLKKEFLSKLSIGTHSLVVRFKDTYAETMLVVKKTAVPTTIRFVGSDRAQTASLISSGMYKTADTVVLATGFDFHDALAAVPLASAYNAPLLLADRDNLSAKTLAEIKRLKAKNVIVVATTTAKDNNGNDAAIKSKVYTQLKGYKVTKLVGSSYYETAKKVAVQLKTKTKKNPTSVFITTDKNFADALSASPVAAILGAPILYVDPKATLNTTTKNYLASIKKSVKNVYIVGGVNAVSKSVEKAILNTLGKKSATRFAGDNRYETCVKINNAFNSILTGNSVCIAKGYNFPDALAGGVFAAKQKAPLFLADALGGKATISKTQVNYLYIKNPSKLYIFGGETAVPTELVKTIAKACV